MNKTIKILGIVFVAVLALAALGAGVAFAQTPVPGFGPGWMMGGNGQTGYGPGMMGGHGGMMSGYAQDGDGWEWMNSMHQRMSNFGLHDNRKGYLVDYLARDFKNIFFSDNPEASEFIVTPYEDYAERYGMDGHEIKSG